MVERQDRAPQRFGRSFADWAATVPNLQTELLLSSKAAFTASFAPIGHADLAAWQARWATPQLREARRALALETAGAFDILGTTERFDETTLLATRALNWSVSDSIAPPRHRDAAPEPAESCLKRGPRARAVLPWWCRVPGADPKRERQRVHHRRPVDHGIHLHAPSGSVPREIHGERAAEQGRASACTLTLIIAAK